MILGVIVLRARTVRQKALTVGSKSNWGRNSGAHIGLSTPSAPGLEDQTYTRGSGMKGEESGLEVLYR